MEIREITEYIEKNARPDVEAVKAAEKRQEILAKPTGALGRLEDMAVKLSGITGKVQNSLKRQAVVIFSADNGVVAEGVASAPQTVTCSQTVNFARHFTGVSSMANYFGIDLMVFDMGGRYVLPEELYTDSPEIIPGGVFPGGEFAGRIINRRLGKGTENLAKGAAMTRAQAEKAVITGFEAVKELSARGYELFGVGEMGIGNTTTSAAVLSALTGMPAEQVSGRGGGINDEGLSRKISVVREAADRVRGREVLEILAAVGGFDICAMAGAYLGAAYFRLPVVIDGYISAVAALAACRLAPNCREFMFGSHQSTEPGYVLAINELKLKPMFDLGMRLGEGSGCPISFKILEAACAAMNGMATYDEGSIDADYLEERKEGNFF